MRSRRRGSVLLQGVFLIFLGMALAALVVDLGIARVTQESMRNGTDVAALEGLRLRDVNPADPAQADLERRLAAASLLARVYDEDLDLDTANVRLLLGAGPTLDNGVVSSAEPAGGLLSSDGPYQPVLQDNAGLNAAHGDFVAGTYTAPLFGLGDPTLHAEDAFYTRNDFVPADPLGAPTATSFLARLRRTPDRQGLDQLPGVSSSGPPLPLLFGLATAIGPGSAEPGAYDPRRDGLTVRATSIADGRRAVAVGLGAPGLLGTVPVGFSSLDPSIPRVLAFADASWLTSLATGAPFEVQVAADGTITGTATGPTPAARGAAQPTLGLVRVGAPALAGPVAGSLAFPANPGALPTGAYVVLYQETGGLTGVVTGFASVSLQAATLVAGPTGETTLVLNGTKLPSLIAPANASAVPGLAVDPSVLPPANFLRASLLAPVLAH